ncbi:hypothetical protein [Brevifollis gellanilyticus]|uniref:Uncharacterized protein n=1 Tax=Brevifollis gellanilyticus TaxID=748831 RepID=A0A512MCU4_9BACT|nr:hypothetical protein [Brevifollis gellanilyticus]GEP44548.1 hypothetical protein BGE01nite_38390 [Brevifollis gellanilyticus]
MRAILCLILVFFALVFESPAVTLEAMLGSSTVSGELVGLAPSSKAISFKIKQASGEEIEVEIYRLNSSSRDKAFAWMSQTARVNAARLPHLRFAATKRLSNVKDPMDLARLGIEAMFGKNTRTDHVLAVHNAGAAATGQISSYQLVKQIKSGQDPYKGIWKEELWPVDNQVVAGLQPGQTRQMAFLPVVEGQSKSVFTASASRGGLSTVEKKQVKFEAVYLMAFDDAGHLIYFAKV